MRGIAPERAELNRAVVRCASRVFLQETAATLQPQWRPAGGVMMDNVVVRAALRALVYTVTPIAARVTHIGVAAVEPTAICPQPSVRVIG